MTADSSGVTIDPNSSSTSAELSEGRAKSAPPEGRRVLFGQVRAETVLFVVALLQTVWFLFQLAVALSSANAIDASHFLVWSLGVARDSLAIIAAIAALFALALGQRALLLPQALFHVSSIVLHIALGSLLATSAILGTGIRLKLNASSGITSNVGAAGGHVDTVAVRTISDALTTFLYLGAVGFLLMALLHVWLLYVTVQCWRSSSPISRRHFCCLKLPISRRDAASSNEHSTASSSSTTTTTPKRPPSSDVE